MRRGALTALRRSSAVARTSPAALVFTSASSSQQAPPASSACRRRARVSVAARLASSASPAAAAPAAPAAAAAAGGAYDPSAAPAPERCENDQDIEIDHPWNIFAGVIIERLPRVMPEPTWWESRHVQAREVERAQTLKQPPKGLFARVPELELRRARDQKPYTPASRTTRYDDDPAAAESLHRSLSERLYLIVQNKDGDWQFPAVRRTVGETLRETAERGLKSSVGNNLVTLWLSNAPAGHFEVERPAEDGKQGDQVLLYRGYHSKGNCDAGSGFAWATRSQLPTYFAKEYHDSVIDLV